MPNLFPPPIARALILSDGTVVPIGAVAEAQYLRLVGGEFVGADLKNVIAGGWKFSDTITDSDPGSGFFRFNNATQSSATQMFVSKNGQSGLNVGAILLALSSGDKIYIQELSDDSRTHVVDITGAVVDATDYVKIPITVLASGSNPLRNNRDCALVLITTGGGGGGGVSSEIFSAHDSVGLVVLPADPTFLDIALVTETKKTSGMTHAASAAEVTVDVAGTYAIFGYATTECFQNSIRTQSELRMVMDTVDDRFGTGYQEVGGTRQCMYNREINEGCNSAHFTVILDLLAGDKIKLQVTVTSGAAADVRTFPNGSGLSIIQPSGQGTKGDTGDVGEAGGGVQSRIHGLVPSNAADADHDITISLGAAVANDNEIVLLASALTKQIDAAWVAGSNLGGLFSGTVANATWYHIFLIRKDSDESIDAGFDTSPIAANIPTGYSSFKRIGSVLTDGSANILGYKAEETAGGGLSVVWANPPMDANENHSATVDLQTLSVPPSIKVWVSMNVRLTDGEDNSLYVFSPDANDEAASRLNAPLNLLSNNHFTSEVTDAYGFIRTRTNTLSQIKWVSLNNGGNRRIVTLSWEEARR